MKIALIGYGKMGRMIEQIALARGHEIVSIIDQDNQQDFDSPAFSSADVAIEFTNPMLNLSVVTAKTHYFGRVIILSEWLFFRPLTAIWLKL